VGTHSTVRIKVADEAWIATALLHREHPRAKDFAINEIVERARQEALSEPLRPGVYVHVVQQCVANRPPAPGRYRMLFETTEGRRRLFRQGDPYHPAREGSKIVPAAEEVPDEYVDLLRWYCEWEKTNKNAMQDDPLLSLRGTGKQLWADEKPDDYVRRLREGWA
jgi:hypothetical protein